MEAANENFHSTFQPLAVAAALVVGRITAGLSCPVTGDGVHNARANPLWCAKFTLASQATNQVHRPRVPRIPVKEAPAANRSAAAGAS